MPDDDGKTRPLLHEAKTPSGSLKTEILIDRGGQLRHITRLCSSPTGTQPAASFETSCLARRVTVLPFLDFFQVHGEKDPRFIIMLGYVQFIVNLT